MAAIEFMPPEKRSLSSAVGPTGEGIMILSILAYFFRPWRMLYWITVAPFSLIFLIYPYENAFLSSIVTIKYCDIFIHIIFKLYAKICPGEP